MNVLKELTSNYTTIKNNKIEYVVCDFAETNPLTVVVKLFNTFTYCPWIFSLIGSILVGLSGVFPLLIIPVEMGENLKVGAAANRLRVLLSFAVGGLLGDVFLHLLPEAWEHGIQSGSSTHPSLSSGIWVLIGMLVFIIVEKLSSSLEASKKIASEKLSANNEMESLSGKKRGPGQLLPKTGKQIQETKNSWNNNNDDSTTKQTGRSALAPAAAAEKPKHYHISGYLNLMANSVDNFTHGLAIGGSFSISFKMGILSTFAILIHELPHEIGDFAILLKSGFSRWDAAKAQICTAFAGIMGSMFAVLYGSSDSLETKTSWILPFTAGGFLHIALVTVLPELVNEESKSESCKQLGSLMFGIGIMAFLIAFFG